MGRIAQNHREQSQAHAHAHRSGGFAAIRARAVVAPPRRVIRPWRIDGDGGRAAVTGTGRQNGDACDHAAAEVRLGRCARAAATGDMDVWGGGITAAAYAHQATAEKFVWRNAAHGGRGRGLLAVGAGDQRELKLARAVEIRAVVCDPALVGKGRALGKGGG